MLFRGSKDGFKAEDFHRLCNGKGKTVALIKTEAEGNDFLRKEIAGAAGQIRISGGYTDINWTSPPYNGDYKSGSGNSFIFLLKDEKDFIKLRCKNKQ